MRVPFSYLDRQFADIDDYLRDVEVLVKSGDFTLGAAVAEFEGRFAKLCRMPHAVGVGSGTDALVLSLKALGVGAGDEVITCAATFIATVGAIAMTGAKPVLVDNEDGFVIDPDKIERAITKETKAIVPVHYTGNMADMPRIMEIAETANVAVVEDACQAIMGEIDGKPAGSWGAAAAYSLHPLKNLNVWGDGGLVTTRSAEMAEKIKLLRNHGLINRNESVMFGGNSRLDSLQAVVGNRLIGDTQWITKKRIEIAGKYDKAFERLGEQVRVPPRRQGVKHVFHLYMIRVGKRDALLEFLNAKGVEAKIHYPVPLHLQKAASHLGYREGDFPKAEEDSRRIITLPAHQHLTDEEVDYTIEKVYEFYKR